MAFMVVIMGLGLLSYILLGFGWLSKLWSFFRYPKYEVPQHNTVPKKRNIILTTTHMGREELVGIASYGNFISVS